MQRQIDMLRTLPLFSDLNDAEVARLAAHSQLMRRNRGDYLFRHGDDITTFATVCRGTVQVFRETPDGHEMTSDILIAGDNVNADEILSRQTTHLNNARVVDDAVILEVPIQWMRDNLQDFDDTGSRLLQSLSERLQAAQREAEHRSTFSATQLVACYLQGLCVLYDYDPRGFTLPYSKTLIASRLRMELATFSRTLQKLKDSGITIEGNRVSFTNLNKAGHFVCDNCSIADTCPAHKSLSERT